MRRILFLNPGAEIGGAERSLLELLGGLPEDRYESHLMLPWHGPLIDAAREAGATVTVHPWPQGILKVGREYIPANRLLALLSPLLMAPVVIRLARYMRSEQIDMLHTNGTKAHIMGSLAASLARVPLLWHLRDVLAPGTLSSILKAMARVFPTRIIANSQASAKSLISSATTAKFAVIYNGLDLSEFEPRPSPPGLRASLGIGHADFVIGTLGALSPLKGHEYLIRAMPAVLREAPGARLLLVGEEMYETLGHRGHRASLEHEVQHLGLTDRVIFTGRRDDVVALYSCMDIVVLSSVRPESFGRILVEAMACERPVIATDLGGPREIIPSPDDGILVPPADPAAMAHAILSLYRGERRRRRL
ncbi:MAG: glycosyltransferase, partial [Acidobacteriota bacterium]